MTVIIRLVSGKILHKIAETLNMEINNRIIKYSKFHTMRHKPVLHTLKPCVKQTSHQIKETWFYLFIFIIIAIYVLIFTDCLKKNLDSRARKKNRHDLKWKRSSIPGHRWILNLIWQLDRKRILKFQRIKWNSRPFFGEWHSKMISHIVFIDWSVQESSVSLMVM